MPVYDCLAILTLLTLHVRKYTIAYYMLIALRLLVPVIAHLKLQSIRLSWRTKNSASKPLFSVLIDG